MRKEFIDINKKWWNSRVDSHYKSTFYDVNAFIEGKNSLNNPELDLLGDIKGKKVLHLQCHFGMDSISLERLGAKVTAIDFSLEAIKQANKLKERLKSDVKFICCEVYETSEVLKEEFDIVFTSYGTITWLSELDQWAKQISLSLKPSGIFIFADFHPVVWMYDDDIVKPTYPYSSSQAIILDESDSYAQKNESFESKHITWNHGIADTFNALKNNGIIITEFKEFLEAPYPFLSKCIKISNGYQIKDLEGILPLMYTLKGKKSQI